MFLDYGGDVASFPCLEGLAEAVVVRRRLNSAPENASDLAFYRSCVERWVCHGPTAVAELAGGEFTADQATVTAFAWAAECYADPVLAERFERAIPADLYLESMEWVTERRARGVGEHPC